MGRSAAIWPPRRPRNGSSRTGSHLRTSDVPLSLEFLCEHSELTADIANSRASEPWTA
jgi:hypothetical protein